MDRLSYFLIVISTSLLLVSCGGAETTKQESPAAERTTDDNIPDNKPAASAPVAQVDTISLKPVSNEILSRIDKYLVSTPVYNSSTTGTGITNAVVTIKNTLSDVTFQKAIVEIAILGSDGKELRSDYYPIQNIEPGDVETIKIPDNDKAASIVCHVVKVKSNRLTNGEMVLVGTHYEAGK